MSCLLKARGSGLVPSRNLDFIKGRGEKYSKASLDPTLALGLVSEPKVASWFFHSRIHPLARVPHGTRKAGYGRSDEWP